MQPDLISQDKEQEEMESDVYSQDHEDGNMQCDPNSQEKEDEEMHSNVNVEVGASLPNGASSSLLLVKQEVTTEQGNIGNVTTEQETPSENITQSVPRACASTTTKSQQSDSTTGKFEGYDVRCDLVPTLQKIWQKYGNILESSIIRSGDIIGRALESLATMVCILEDNSAHSLTSSQADYVNSTLSDLGCMCFNVCWLTPFVENAIKLHQCKPLFDSLKNFNQLIGQVKERRAILFEELSKLGMEENKVKEKMAEVSKKIPFSAQVKLEQPLGLGLT